MEKHGDQLFYYHNSDWITKKYKWTGCPKYIFSYIENVLISTLVPHSLREVKIKRTDRKGGLCAKCFTDQMIQLIVHSVEMKYLYIFFMDSLTKIVFFEKKKYFH